MRTILFLSILLPNFIECFATEGKGTGDTPERNFCTLMGSTTTIQVKISSSKPLPSNLAFALNGKNVIVDECKPEPSYKLNLMELSSDRTLGLIKFNIDSSPENFNLYFSRGYEQPSTDLMNLIIYHRANCADPHSEIQEISDIKISWEPVYINGKHCGVTSFSGESQVDL